MSLSLAAELPRKLWVSFLPTKKKNQTKKPNSDYEVFCLLLFFKKNRNKKGFNRATLSKIVLLWGFHLLDFFFFRWMACKFCANCNVLFQIVSCY